ncbi:MAG: AhpC/TSA family protein [Alphaproteobacteria bacterium]|nr:AhpC/TSA family protein [Alphaproteobacteria bacterium]MBM3952454.1 AhpC/TSA family protein [Rhodospirillales bacterium]
MMSLEAELAKIRTSIAQTAPGLWAENARQIGALIAANAASGALGVGEVAPEFSLPATTGQVVSSDVLLARGPAVVVFFRGGWCPFCVAAMVAFDRVRSRLEHLGAALVGIAPGSEDQAAETARRLRLGFPLLADRELRAARLFGLAHDLLPDLAEALERAGVDRSCLVGAWGTKLPIPATYVIRRDGAVAWAFVDPDFTRRAEPEYVAAAVERLTAEDVSTVSVAR